MLREEQRKERKTGRNEINKAGQTDGQTRAHLLCAVIDISICRHLSVGNSVTGPQQSQIPVLARRQVVRRNPRITEDWATLGLVVTQGNATPTLSCLLPTARTSEFRGRHFLLQVQWQYFGRKTWRKGEDITMDVREIGWEGLSGFIWLRIGTTGGLLW